MAETAEGDGRPWAVVLLEELGGPQVGNAWEEIVFQCAERSMELAQRSSFADSHHNYAEGLLMAVKMRREQDEIQASWRSGKRSIFRMAQARAEMEAPPTTVEQSGGTKAEKLKVTNYSTSASNEQ